MLTLFFTVFVSVFLAELGDKTQIATLLFATDTKASPMMVFVASATALVLSSLIAVLAGTLAKNYLTKVPLELISGCVFVLLGLISIYSYFK